MAPPAPCRALATMPNPVTTVPTAMPAVLTIMPPTVPVILPSCSPVFCISPTTLLANDLYSCLSSLLPTFISSCTLPNLSTTSSNNLLASLFCATAVASSDLLSFESFSICLSSFLLLSLSSLSVFASTPLFFAISWRVLLMTSIVDSVAQSGKR